MFAGFDLHIIFQLTQNFSAAIRNIMTFAQSMVALTIFMVLLLLGWVFIPRPKDATNISFKNTCRFLFICVSFIILIVLFRYYTFEFDDFFLRLFGLSSFAFFDVLIVIGGIGFAAYSLFVAFGESKEPNNSSLLNRRQKYLVIATILLIIVGFALFYLISPQLYKVVFITIFLVAEFINILFWFYDPLIYIIAKFFKFNTKPPCPQTPNKVNRLAIIGCAHNEALVITELIKSVFRNKYRHEMFDMYVICDNCTDNTAEKVREAGAYAMERNDLEKRGKGFGLEWMFAILQEKREKGDAYDAYIVLDADNVVNERYLELINEQLNEGYEILQTYLGCKNPYDTWISKCYSFAYWITNANFQDAHSRLGLTAQMGGTGMVIRPEVLDDIGWNTDSLTEDLVLTATYILKKNKSCRWVHDARLYDEKPLKLKPSIRQRTRWMQGHIDCMFRCGHKLFLEGIKNLSWRQLDMSFYLYRPLLNIIMFACYTTRWFCVFFFPDSFMNIQFFMNFNTALVLLTSYFLFQLFILGQENYLKNAIWVALQWVFTYSWYPAIFRGIIKHKEKYWVSTVHVRDIGIEDVKEDKSVIDAFKRLEGIDNLHRLPLGQILLKAGIITKLQLETAITIQRQSGVRIGDVLIHQGYVDEETMNAYVSVQATVKENISSEMGYTPMPIGKILVNAELITEQQVNDALSYKNEHGGFVGEALVSLGYIKPEILKVFLQFQKTVEANFMSENKISEIMITMHNAGVARIGDLLKSSGVITDIQLEIALENQKTTGNQLGHVLIELGYVDKDTIHTMLSMQEMDKQDEFPHRDI